MQHLSQPIIIFISSSQLIIIISSFQVIIHFYYYSPLLIFSGRPVYASRYRLDACRLWGVEWTQ